MATTTMTPMKQFCKVYADAVIPLDTPEDEWKAKQEAAEKERQLSWHGERMSLAEAAKLYAKIHGYNDFEPNMIADLEAAFPDSGIEVTPARESSVAIYLHFPEDCTVGFEVQIRAFIDEHWSADEVDIVAKFTCLQEGEPELVGEALRIWWD